MKPKPNNLPLGSHGEEIAAHYLKSHGFNIIERNFRKGYGEIDIICYTKNLLVFVEVKTRISDQFGSPEEAITPWKLRSLIKSAQYYKMLHPELPDELRIDLLSIVLTDDGKVEKIDHIENISGF